MAYRIRLQISCLFLAAVLLYPAPAGAQSVDRAGEVAEINQSGLQLHAGRTAWLDQGDDVIRYARLETDNFGEMALVMDDGSHLVLLPNSDIAIDDFVYDPERTAGQAVISLGRGALRMISGRLPSERYQVRTPIASIGLRGTDFTAEMINGSELLVRVDEGAVEILPSESADRFTVNAGQVSRCTRSGCEDASPDDQAVRHARLGPPLAGAPDQGAGAERNRGQSAQGDSRETGVSTSIELVGQMGVTAKCAPYRIPSRAYRRVGLNPANWPEIVEGITFHRHSPEGLQSKHYCPHEVTSSGNQRSFTILGQAAPGDTKVLYYVNVFPGRDLFLPGFDLSAREKSDAKAYESYMPRVFADEQGVRIVESKADMQRTTSGQLVLQQRAAARGLHGDYLVTGLTLYRSVSEDRTALFAIPAVVSPRSSAAALTANDVARALYQQVPEIRFVGHGTE